MLDVASKTMAATLAILGATGKTGKWAVKGALSKGWNVRLLVRDPAKVEPLIRELFPARSDDDVKSLLDKKVTAVKCNAFEETELVELMSGSFAVLSFVGMVNRGENVVDPAVRAVIAAMEAMADRAPTKFITMSSIGLNDGTTHGYKAWGHVTMCATRCIPGLKASFADMAIAEDVISEARESNPKLNVIVVRCAILGDAKDYLCDYATEEKKYNLVYVGENGPFSFSIDRQHVAQAFLCLCQDSTGFDNTDVSCFDLDGDSDQGDSDSDSDGW